ncbi:MAG TPA: DUF6232 family protein [Thermoanaerobaculia bacterium]|nr:DUF6232 family protein [Thermoanaerobaculia bacterium]
MADEVSVYQDSTIAITNLRAMLQGKTYAMANITSVSMFTQYASKLPGVVIAVLGGLIVLIGLPSTQMRGCFMIFGVVLLLAGIGVYRAAQNMYFVRIGSASGETNALQSRDHEYIQKIVNAMNEAIVRRG